MNEPSSTDVLIVGAGFSGLAMAARCQRAGRPFVVVERGPDVGGVWRDNTYPGAACDVPSHLYSLSFAPNPGWTRTYSHQPEIHAYLRRTAREQGLDDHIRFNTELIDARWTGEHWEAETTGGTIVARALVAAAGPLVEPKLPTMTGLDAFPGPVFHSARWDHSADLEDKRVAVIGTGASAIQFIPQIQPKAGHLTVFQRTPPWVLPRTERPITRAERRLYARLPGAQEAMRRGVYWLRELGSATPLVHPVQPSLIAVLGKAHLRRQVRDAELRAKLTPHYTPGCKRLLLSNDYYPALAAPNVTVHATGAHEVRGSTVVGSDGSEAEADVIIFGTGFEVTRPPIAHRLRRTDGVSLDEHWGGSMSAHRSTTVAGFPNLFFLLGPNTGTGHTSVIQVAEAQADYAMAALDELDRRGAAAVEPTAQAEAAWQAEVQRRSQGTVWLEGGCASWYLDAEGNNTTLWPDYIFRFQGELARFRPEEHQWTPERVAAPV